MCFRTAEVKIAPHKELKIINSLMFARDLFGKMRNNL